MIVDNQLEDLSFILDKDCDIELVDTSSEIGARIYRRSIVFMLIKACRELFPHSELIVKHSLSNGLYCELLDQPLTDRDIEQIQKRMREYVVRDLPIIKRVVSREEARRIYARQCQLDKVSLLEFRNKDTVHIYELDSFTIFLRLHAPRTSAMIFPAAQLLPGMILQTPEAYKPDGIRPFADLPKLFNIYQEAKEWAMMLGTPHVAAQRHYPRRRLEGIDNDQRGSARRRLPTSPIRSAPIRNQAGNHCRSLLPRQDHLAEPLLMIQLRVNAAPGEHLPDNYLWIGI